MSDQLRDLVRPVGEFDPPHDLHSRIIERERALDTTTSRLRRRLSPMALRVAAVAQVILVLGALALAAHWRDQHARPATSTSAPPACPAGSQGNVFRNGFELHCGPGSAVLRTAGHLQMMPGYCVMWGGWMYFGAYTPRNAPHTALTLHVAVGDRPADQPKRLGRPYPIDGFVQTGPPDVDEPVTGTAEWASNSPSRGTFTLHGHKTAGVYTGSWNCGSLN